MANDDIPDNLPTGQVGRPLNAQQDAFIRELATGMKAVLEGSDNGRQLLSGGGLSTEAISCLGASTSENWMRSIHELSVDMPPAFGTNENRDEDKSETSQSRKT